MTAWTPDERLIARNLSKSTDTIAFLEKLFCPEVETSEMELAKNVAALNDAEYGHLMKIVFLTKASFREKLSLMKRLGAGGDTPPSNRAPK